MFLRAFNWVMLVVVAVVAAVRARADYPVVSHRYAADPTGLKWNGRLYIFCSNDNENDTNSYLMHSFVCFSTDDLKNWTDHGVVFDVPSNASWASLAWAPSVRLQLRPALYVFRQRRLRALAWRRAAFPRGRSRTPKAAR